MEATRGNKNSIDVMLCCVWSDKSFFWSNLSKGWSMNMNETVKWMNWFFYAFVFHFSFFFRSVFFSFAFHLISIILKPTCSGKIITPIALLPFSPASTTISDVVANIYILFQLLEFFRFSFLQLVWYLIML